MIGLDFLAAGVAVRRNDKGRLVVEGPEERRDLRDQLDFEIAMRLDFTQVRPRAWCCDYCGDKTGHDVDAWDGCPICTGDAEVRAAIRCPLQFGGRCLICGLTDQRRKDIAAAEAKPRGRAPAERDARPSAISPGLLAERGVRVLERRDGEHVVLTGAGRNTEAFRAEVLAWLSTSAGRNWLALGQSSR